MRARELWRTTTFRLSAFYGLAFALATIALLGMVYWQSATYLSHRVDRILITEMAALSRSPPRDLPSRIQSALSLNGGRINIFALFSADHVWIAGNLHHWPAGLRDHGGATEMPPTLDFPVHARVIASRLPSGQNLIVGRDVELTRELRSIIGDALFWSGALIILMGAGFGLALSVQRLRRLKLITIAAEDIAHGNLKRRMPISNRRDELDTIAETVNVMVAEIERLMGEVKASTDTIAHDLRTPLTRARARLHRVQQTHLESAPELLHVTAEIDDVLERFRALLRISELEAQDRHAAFAPTSLLGLLTEVVELYRPVADDNGARLFCVEDGGDAMVEADAKLLFEAISNLVDNALKFTGSGGIVRLRIAAGPFAPRIVVEDNGPGVSADEHAAVLQRFYRSERSRMTPGSGLGLSIVAAIARLHRFGLSFEDAEPGLRVVIDCNSSFTS